MREHLPQVAPFLRVGGREWFLPAALRALNHREYRLFWFGQLVSLTGTWMQSTAQQWLVYRLTGSSLKLGLVLMVGTLPVTFLSLFAGVLVDRVDKRRLMLQLQFVMMLLATTLAVLTALGVVTFGHVLVLAFLVGTVNAFDMPTRQSLTVELVGRADLMNAVALNSSIFNGARLAGPAVAGVLIARFGEAPAFAINALSYVAILAALLAMRLPHAPREGERRHPLHEMREGLAYLGGHRRARMLIALVAVPCVFAFPFTTLIPVIAVERLGLSAGGFGALISSLGFGALAGASLLAAMSATRDASRGLLLARIVTALAIILVALSRSVPLSCLGMALVGWGLITHLATSNTLLQLAVPDRLRGRVMGVYTWCVVGTAPVGGLFMGATAERFGASAAMMAGAALCLLVVAVAPRLPEEGGGEAA